MNTIKHVASLVLLIAGMGATLCVIHMFITVAA